MDTTAAFEGLACPACGATATVAPSVRCPDCGGPLDPTYDYDAVSLSTTDLDAEPGSLWAFDSVLPFSADVAVSTGEGGTPAVECPALAAELGVGSLTVLDDGRNPTGSTRDRECSLALTAVANDDERDGDDVALATTGAGGQSAAAYAGRAGVVSHAFVPSRAGFVRKAMINVHGGDMSVVGGRYPDAADAYEAALDDENWTGIGPGDSPFRHEGAKTILYEIAARADGDLPDAVVVPAGHGTTLAGLGKAARELQALGLADEVPALYAAQAEGCAPLVRAAEAGAETATVWETPDTICGSLEIPVPAYDRLALRAIRETDGGAVATPDDDVLESGVVVAQHEGLEVGTAGAAAASGAWKLAEDGVLGADDDVVLLNPSAGAPEGDVLRSHLMGQGV